ncbi:hypothetical protein RclHR1_11220006 [Rhizophagus clarus]|uniref:Ion transport domain-containing protein n=1 Tax=Rhizophagus clarus TaxID=94130 RepID=A0A2Z6Q3Z4_9GLOM|nr:hypothetical protein RclHR1_11220006 [Rhizophagus clarus]GES84869.1 hypothetical protein GLOIN_2v1781806 [Rhizophagus clarus]
MILLNNENSEDDSKNKFILYEFNSELKKAFGFVDGKFSYKNLNLHKFIESYKEEDNFVGWNNYLCQATEKNYYNDTLAFLDMENTKSLFSDEHENIVDSKDINFNDQKYIWKIDKKENKLSVYTDKELCSIKLDLSNLCNWKIFYNNALALRCCNYIEIYEYDINNNNIKILYFFRSKSKLNDKDFSGPIFPMPSEIIYKDEDNFIKIIKSIIEDDRCLAKYGPTLLPILIKLSDPRLPRYIEDIYNKCTKLVKEDPKRNLKFLNIITSGSHLYAFNQEIEIRKLRYEKLLLEYIKYAKNVKLLKFVNFILYTIVEVLIFLQNLIYLLIVTLHEKYNKKYYEQRNQQIVLVVPYIGYSSYPLEYSWWKEIIYPQPSIFVGTCERSFYTSLNGEAITNFKWNKFGRKYHCAIWLLFSVLFICFTIASYPTNSITQEIQIKLYRTSIAFGFFHLIFELRQLFFWKPRKYFSSIWNLFDLDAYLSATIVSIYWIKYDDIIPDWALSIICLMLDLKFLLFFRAFESFGVYFAIMFGVAKRIFSFLVVLAIIIASFAHAFFLLLHPRDFLNSLDAPNPDDPNNPWTLSNTYNQTDENGNVLDETLIQVPSESTNLFYSYPTSLLATYLFLTGNQNSLSPWAPKPTAENTILFILMALFSFLVVIYLMNLIIGLLNMSIEKDIDRASYLVQKAEVIAEIELFYLLPHQRRWISWFPELIYYRVDVEKARLYVREAINKGEWKKEDWPEMKYKILKLLSIEDAILDLAV